MRDHHGPPFDPSLMIAGIVVLLIVGIATIAKHCEAPPPCRDTVRVVSAISLRKPELTCGPGQIMTIERQWQGAVVTCTCSK